MQSYTAKHQYLGQIAWYYYFHKMRIALTRKYNNSNGNSVLRCSWNHERLQNAFYTTGLTSQFQYLAFWQATGSGDPLSIPEQEAEPDPWSFSVGRQSQGSQSHPHLCCPTGRQSPAQLKGFLWQNARLTAPPALSQPLLALWKKNRSRVTLAITVYILWALPVFFHYRAGLGVSTHPSSLLCLSESLGSY